MHPVSKRAVSGIRKVASFSELQLRWPTVPSGAVGQVPPNVCLPCGSSAGDEVVASLPPEGLRCAHSLDCEEDWSFDEAALDVNGLPVCGLPGDSGWDLPPEDLGFG